MFLISLLVYNKKYIYGGSETEACVGSYISNVGHTINLTIMKGGFAKRCMTGDKTVSVVETTI